MAAVGVALGIAGAARGETVATNFESGTAEGWGLIGLTSPVSGLNGLKSPANYTSTIGVATTGGVDGAGYIYGTDNTPDALYFAAAAVFLGSKTAFTDGTLSFAIRNQGDSAVPIGPNDSPLILVNSKTTKALYQSVMPTVTTAFSTLTYKLGLGGGWKLNSKTGPDATAADFAEVLGDLGAAYILADYRAGNGETTSIDNVQMSSPVNSAPESGTVALMLLAASCTLGRRRRLTRPSRAASPRDAVRS